MQKTEPSLSSMHGMVFEILYLFPMSPIRSQSKKDENHHFVGFKPLLSLKSDVTDRILQKNIMNLQCLEKLLFDLFEIFQADIT